MKKLLSKTIKTRRKDRDLLQILNMRKSGMSINKIAESQGCTRNTVSSDLAKLNALIPDNATIEQLDRMKIPIFKGTLLKLVEGMNSPDKLKQASLNNAAYAFTQMHTALRLEEGKSTSNVSYADSLRALKDAKEELRKLNDFNIAPVEVEPGPEYSIPIVREK